MLFSERQAGMSALGQKRSFAPVRPMSALRQKRTLGGLNAIHHPAAHLDASRYRHETL